MPSSEQDEKTRQLQEAYASGSAEKTSEVYDGWSAEYEEHMKGVGYAHPSMVAAMLTRHQPPGEGPYLDAGSGTGIMGQLLTALGYTPVDGFDASAGMLSFAREKGIYRDLREGLLGEPLDYADGTFAAVVSSGVFTQGHAPLDGLDELVRVTQPGGTIVFSISRTYLGDVFEAKGKTLEDAGKWRRIAASERYDSAPLGDDVLMAQVFVYAVA